MSQKTDPILARVNASPSQNLIEVVDVGQGLVWALNEENASWFRGVGAPTSFLGQIAGNLYLDTASGNIWQLSSDGETWNEIGNAQPIPDVANAGFREDFISGGSADETVVSTTPSIITFDTPWAVSAVSSGTQFCGLTSSGFPNIGQMILETSATSGHGILLTKALFGTTGISNLGNLGANGPWQIDMIFNIDWSADTNSQSCVRAGVCELGGGVGDPPTDGMWVRYDGAQSDTEYVWEVRASGTSTTSTQNSISVEDSQFHHFRIRSLVAGTILFSVDGGSEAALSTNVSTDYMGAFIQYLTRTNDSAFMYFDFFSFTAQTGRT